MTHFWQYTRQIVQYNNVKVKLEFYGRSYGCYLLSVAAERVWFHNTDLPCNK